MPRRQQTNMGQNEEQRKIEERRLAGKGSTGAQFRTKASRRALSALLAGDRARANIRAGRAVGSTATPSSAKGGNMGRQRAFDEAEREARRRSRLTGRR